MAESTHILTLNVGSSSLKFAIFEKSPENCQPMLRGEFDRIGQTDGQIHWSRSGENASSKLCFCLSPLDAFQHLVSFLREQFAEWPIHLIAHRVVHGGTKFFQPTRLQPEVLESLRQIQHLAPNHLPAEIAVMEAAMMQYPQSKQTACFDTGFHSTRPELHQRYAIPESANQLGIRRYGFHGLSYQSVLRELRRQNQSITEHGRIIIAHLGNGSSLCAIQDGESWDTTMGFTPNGGLIMGTRCGDIDPEIPLFLLEQRNIPIAEVRQMLTQQSGLLGVSGSSADMQTLLASEANDASAKLAIEMYVSQVAKQIAALFVSLGRLDGLVFTGGIGYHSAAVRERILSQVQCLGIIWNAEWNQSQAFRLSPLGSPVAVHVVRSDEEQILAESALT